MQRLSEVEQRAIRLTALARWFECGGRGTAAQIARRYGVSTRTIQRDLLSLNYLVPITEDHSVYYALQEPRR